MDELPLSVRGRLLSGLASTLATLPPDAAQTWRLGQAVRLMLGADGVAITLQYLSDHRITLCASDEVAVALENLQEVLGHGPGFDAATHDTVVVADLDGDADQRWPMLAQAVESRFGPRRLYAVPVHADGGLDGVATLHTGPDVRLAEPVDHVQFLVNAVGAALVADAGEHDPDGRPQADGGWGSRSVVHQATGMVMAQVRVTPADALALLRGHAYALATDVNDVAERVVARTIDFVNFDVEGD